MRDADCSREDEAFASVVGDRWPDGCDEDLRGHVAGCAICASVIEVGLALREAYDADRRNARVPAADLVWRRAQMRGRAEAAHAASGPITLVQAAAIAGGASGTMALVVAAWPWLQARLAWLTSLASSIDPIAIAGVVGAALVPPGAELAIVLAVAGWLVLAPAAIYLAVTDD